MVVFKPLRHCSSFSFRCRRRHRYCVEQHKITKQNKTRKKRNKKFAFVLVCLRKVVLFISVHLYYIKTIPYQTGKFQTQKPFIIIIVRLPNTITRFQHDFNILFAFSMVINSINAVVNGIFICT